jgi:hypothetical protein
MIRSLLSIKGMHNYNYQDFISAVSFFKDHFTGYPLMPSLKKSLKCRIQKKHMNMQLNINRIAF